MDRGNAILIGVPGLGKQSLTKLASFIIQFQLCTVELGRGFDLAKFKEWLRINILVNCGGKQAGPKGKQISFLLTDSQIIDESILEDINNLLNSGEVPNIFPAEAKDKLISEMGELCQEIGRGADDPMKVFVERVRNNLHIILCMSPVGEKLRVRCRKFPALINCCTIDWFNDWPSEAIKSVSMNLMEDLEMELEMREKICDLIKEFHEDSVETAMDFTTLLKRPYYITPKTLLDFVHIYIKLLIEKKTEILNNQETLKKGSIKIKETNLIVAQLKIDLIEAQPELELQNKLAEETLIKLKASSAIAEEKTEYAEKQAELIQNQKDQVQMVTDKVNSQLAESLPRIEEAETEVKNLDRSQLITFRSLRVAPDAIVYVLKTVCLVLGEKFDDWKTSGHKLLMDLDKFMKRLLDKLDQIKTQGAGVIPEGTLKL
jgi:dynein heavy chain